MVDAVLNQARMWGFPCERSDRNWQIFPRDKRNHWLLEQAEDRWLLSIRGVPQIYFHPSEAIAFLELRYRKDREQNTTRDNWQDR